MELPGQMNDHANGHAHANGNGFQATEKTSLVQAGKTRREGGRGEGYQDYDPQKLHRARPFAFRWH